MPQVKPAAPPGFNSQATQVQARAAWFGGNLVRWRTSYLEKMGGWRRLIDDVMPAIVRRMHGWLDLQNKKNLLIATDAGVQLLVQKTLYDIGLTTDLQGGFNPVIGDSGDATKFTVANASKTVTVKTSVGLVQVGQKFGFRVPISIGGRIIAAGSVFPVKAVSATGFTFDMPLASLAAETDTYGIPLLTNDIVNSFTVTWKSHGLSVGAPIRIGVGTSLKVGTKNVGTPPNLTYNKVDFTAPAGTIGTVATVVDADHFTIKMATFGTGDGTGTATHQVYVGSSIENPDSGAMISTIGSVIGLINAQAPINPQRDAWFLANMGEQGLVLASGRQLEVYTPPIENGPFLSLVPTAPTKSNGMLVAMPQAQVILFGTEPVIGSGVIDPLLIRFTDVGRYDVYTATATNQAGTYRLSRGSRIVGAIQAPQATLILTDTDLWQMSYVGPPLVYGFTIMGSGCGLVAPHAIGTLGRTTVWQGLKNFWQFGDTALQPVPCTVWDYIFEDIDTVNINKCHAGSNGTTNELAFYFPSKHTMIFVDKNLLLFSQLFWDPSWIRIGTVPTKFSLLIKVFYVYEPNYKNNGWWEDAGIALIAWWDRDLQSEIKDIIFAPDGTETSFMLFEDDSNGLHEISQSLVKAGERITYTFSLYAHDSSTRNMTLRATAGDDGAYATFDVVSGNRLAAGVTSPKFALSSAYVTTDGLANNRIGPNGNGWRRYVLVFTSDDSEELSIHINVTNGTDLNYQGDPSRGIMIWGAQLVLGGDPLDYQPTEGVIRQNETRRYVKVNSAENFAWDSGRLGRSAWLDVSVWGTPLGADITPIRPVSDRGPLTQVLPAPRNLIQQHEIGFDDDDQPMTNVYAETGYTQIAEGSTIMLIDQVQPDMKWFGLNGGVTVSLRAANYAQGPSHLYGPYTITPTTQFFNPRVRARYVAVRYDWEPKLGFSARVGAVSFEVKPAGRLP